MSVFKTDIIIIKGAPASGKTQTAKNLATYFPKGVRMEIDNLRSMVISTDWTNQKEHINILDLSSNLVKDFYQLGFKPIIVIDTFSGDKLFRYFEKLMTLNNKLAICIFGLYTNDEELQKRLDNRNCNQFKDFFISKNINEDTLKFKHENEFQIDTTELNSSDTAKIIYEELMKRNNIIK